ncbi:hypothetical protein BXZ70DRAFT_523151 [Cristinia sonorae]|uniref:Uncharacterized protein n=1 Tax=Cristinia sonorae TaxID=1940300 RepID=A0A8K0UWE8_9AGAR|nr:hypothetical protein BXZ70DRAFT_523151 [Cristinia sonorae]
MLFLALAQLGLMAVTIALPPSNTTNAPGSNITLPALSTTDGTQTASCDGINGGVHSLEAFSLSAVHKDNSSELLVLGQGGVVNDIDIKVFSTFSTFPFNDFPTITLDSGNLTPNGDDSDLAVTAPVNEGDELSFMFSMNPPPPASIYCAVPIIDSKETFHLAVNGDADSFSLCQTGRASTSQVNVVFKPSQNNSESYFIDTCKPVKLLMKAIEAEETSVGLQRGALCRL